MPLNTSQDLVVNKLDMIYDAEQQALTAYPQIMGAVQSPELKQALQQHMEQTQPQVQWLDQVFG